MCFSQPKPPSPPKPKPLEPIRPTAIAAAPVQPLAAPKKLQPEGSKPDLRIGNQKTATRSSRKAVNNASLKSGLNTSGDSGGINI